MYSIYNILIKVILQVLFNIFGKFEINSPVMQYFLATDIYPRTKILTVSVMTLSLPRDIVGIIGNVTSIPILGIPGKGGWYVLTHRARYQFVPKLFVFYFLLLSLGNISYLPH